MPPSPSEDERIVRDPRVMVGKPVVRGTRIPVERILEQLAFNLDLDDLFGAYPELTREDVKACLLFALRAVERDRSEAGVPESGVMGGTTRASS
jgi:uncharacterized protein (DUF433 family)